MPSPKSPHREAREQQAEERRRIIRGMLDQGFTHEEICARLGTSRSALKAAVNAMNRKQREGADA